MLDDLYAARATIDRVAEHGPLGPHLRVITRPVIRYRGGYACLTQMPVFDAVRVRVYDPDWETLADYRGPSQLRRPVKLVELDDSQWTGTPYMADIVALQGWGRISQVRNDRPLRIENGYDVGFANLLGDSAEAPALGECYVAYGPVNDYGYTFVIRGLADGAGRPDRFDYEEAGLSGSALTAENLTVYRVETESEIKNVARRMVKNWSLMTDMPRLGGGMGAEGEAKVPALTYQLVGVIRRYAYDRSLDAA